MSEQEASQEEEYDVGEEEEEDEEYPGYEREHRSRFFFAVMCFLIALLLLSFYLNNYLDFGSGLLLLCGVIAFAYMGILFWRRGSVLNRTVNAWMESDGKVKSEEDAMAMMGTEIEETEEAAEDAEENAGKAFEKLVEEALASIPEEFHEQMENVLVRVENEPGEEVLTRVGVKAGYTLLGLYEGAPLTTYGHGRGGGPEIITIYQDNIERYCHWDPDRIREQVRHTVLHEVAHHFGIDHDEMPIWVR